MESCSCYDHGGVRSALTVRAASGAPVCGATTPARSSLPPAARQPPLLPRSALFLPETTAAAAATATALACSCLKRSRFPYIGISVSCFRRYDVFGNFTAALQAAEDRQTDRESQHVGGLVVAPSAERHGNRGRKAAILSRRAAEEWRKLESIFPLRPVNQAFPLFTTVSTFLCKHVCTLNVSSRLCARHLLFSAYLESAGEVYPHRSPAPRELHDDRRLLPPPEVLLPRENGSLGEICVEGLHRSGQVKPRSGQVRSGQVRSG